MSVPRIVADTSALLTQARSGVTDSSLWDVIRKGRVVPLVSLATYAEFREKLADPRFSIPEAERASILAEYLSYAEYTRDVPDSGNEVCRDEKDRPFVDLALAKEADAIVSVDPDLLDCNGLWDFPVLNVTEFVRRFS